MYTTLPTLHPDLLTVAQVAQRQQIGRNKVYALANSGVIPAIRIGGAIRVPRGALERWIEAQCQAAVALAENF